MAVTPAQTLRLTSFDTKPEKLHTVTLKRMLGINYNLTGPDRPIPEA